MKLDLNADLGEGESVRRTRALMRRITSCNIACGVHAGSLPEMKRCVELAVEQGVRVGAHPGAPGEMGRGRVTWSVDEFQRGIATQTRGIRDLANQHQVSLHHIKLHGALYHCVERQAEYRDAFLESVARHFPGIIVYALAGGQVVAAARAQGIDVWEEGFLDRGYRDDGTLIPRGERGAILEEVTALRARVHELARHGGIRLGSGNWLRPRTLCLHGDHPDSVRIAALASHGLRGMLDSR